MPILKDNILLNCILILILLLPLMVLDDLPVFSKSDKSGSGFAVVELFTSEGCSSCPPADKVLSSLIQEAKGNDKKVFGLSFHVDYWDYIGWKDPYSDKRYTVRQRAYGEVFGNSRIYTPQMIINGQKEFVGSRQSKAKRSVEEALANTTSLKIDLQVKLTGKEVLVNYSIPALPAGAVINLAWVESGLAQNVSRGENRGRLLRHDNVVRDFKILKTKNGEYNFELKDIVIENACVIAYIQDVKSKRILGAEGIYLQNLN